MAPGFTCSERKLTPYPYEVIGVSTGFVVGNSVVCGGAKMEYVDCVKPPSSGHVCDRNIECVKTAGGTKWCTGPKTKECYTYDSIFKVSDNGVC